MTKLCAFQIVAKEIEEKAGIITLFQSSVLRKYFLTLIFAWFSLNVTYFCLSLNVGKFGMDVFLTQFIFGLSEIPAHILCIWLLEALGRKISVMATLVIGGSLCILILAVPQGNAVAVTVLATLGRFFTNWAGSVCGIYVQELFPTSFRQTASGLGSVASRAGGLVAPLLNMLEIYHKSIPTVVFSSITIISGALCFLLPETRRKELPDTLNDAEDYRNKITRKYQEETLEPHQKSSTQL